MSVLVHGEISANGKDVVIMAAGPDYAVAKEAKKLALITPLVRRSDPPGALLMPLSWPGCVQIAFTFGRAWVPGPKLTQWLMTQVSMRTGYMAKEIRYQLPKEVRDLGHSLYWWQDEDVRMIAHCGGGLVTDDPGLGKFLRNDQPVLTPTGWTAIGKLQVGDKVVGSNGRATDVVGVYPQGIQALFAVTTSDGVTVIAGADHLWTTQTSYDRRRNPSRWGTRTTAEIAATLTVPDGDRRRTNHYLPLLSSPVTGDTVDLPLDPWLIGVLIGDGGLTAGAVCLSNPDELVLAHVRDLLPDNVTLKPAELHDPDGLNWRLSVERGQSNPILKATRALGLQGCRSYEKFIPAPLMHASAKQRYALLTGLLDTDGGVDENNTIEYGTSSPMLAEQVQWLVHSLGGVVHVYRRHAPTYTHKGEKRIGRPAWRLNINLPPGYPPFAHSAKAARYATSMAAVAKRAPIRQIVSVVPVAPDHATCISVDAPDKLYVTAGCVLTHNTISAIVGLAEREAWGHQVTPIVAVVPPGSMIDSWVRAFERWAPHWRTVAWRGTPAKRQALVGHYDVYVTGYAMARKDAAPGISLRDSPLARIAPVSVIADEIQNINNPDAVQTRAVQRLVGTASAFVPMSGTPVTHSVKGLWPTLKVFEDGAFPAGERFVNRYALEVSGDYGAAEIIGLNPMTEPEFRTVLLGRMMRHNKRVCLPDLPDKVYSVREVEIPAAYKKAYRSMEEKMVAELPDGGEITVMGTLAKIIRLQQMSSAAADVETYFELDDKTGEMKEKQKVTLRMPSWKVDALLEILTERPGTQTLVFAPSRQLLVLAGKAAEKAGYRVGYIMGGQNITKERTPTIDAFQAGQIDVMMIVSSAGGAGLTLTKASTEVFLQRPYSFVESTQCEDRGWGRVDGSELKSVEIIDVRAKATIDSRIPAILYDKAEQTSELLRDPRIVAELLGGKTRRHLQAVS